MAGSPDTSTPIMGLLPDLIKEEKDDFISHTQVIIEHNVRYTAILPVVPETGKMNSFSIDPEIGPIKAQGAIPDIVKVHELDLHRQGS